MHSEFIHTINSFEKKIQDLLDCTPIKNGSFPNNMPLEGIYLFSENGVHLYTGRSNAIKKRYGRHCNPGAHKNMATFAFKLARETTGKQKVSYKAGTGTRNDLISNPTFFDAFQNAKKRIKNMEFRFLHEPDQTRQALLEIYCATILKTPYNDFKTT